MQHELHGRCVLHEPNEQGLDAPLWGLAHGSPGRKIRSTCNSTGGDKPHVECRAGDTGRRIAIGDARPEAWRIATASNFQAPKAPEAVASHGNSRTFSLFPSNLIQLLV